MNLVPSEGSTILRNSFSEEGEGGGVFCENEQKKFIFYQNKILTKNFSLTFSKSKKIVMF